MSRPGTGQSLQPSQGGSVAPNLVSHGAAPIFSARVYNARYYDPLIGRFTTADTIIPDPGDPQAFNRYTYVTNNPVRYTDPTGNWPCPKVCDVVDDVAKSGVGLATDVGEVVVDVVDFGGEITGRAIGEGGGLASSSVGAFENLTGVDIPTEKLPYSNTVSAAFAALRGEDRIQVRPEAIGLIQRDPAFQGIESKFLEAIRADERYGSSDFSTILSDAGIGPGISLGGQRGSFNPFDPSSIATWQVAGNDLTWLFRNATIDGTAQVTSSGRIRVAWTVSDRLDLVPTTGRSQAYNTTTWFLGGLWHGFLGASKPETIAMWDDVY